MVKAMRPRGAFARRDQDYDPSSALVGLGFDPVVRAVWLYYQNQMTQGDIAGLLQVSRPTVINYLDEGRKRGLVQVSVDETCLSQVGLARLLCARYGLADCIVIPDDGGAASPSDRVGQAGALLLARELQPQDRIGITSGRSVLALSRAMPVLSLPDVRVVQMTGSVTAHGAFSPELCTSNIAQRIGGRTCNLHAPMLVSSPRVRDIILAEPALIAQFELIHSCNRVLFGVGGLEPSSTIAESKFFSREEIDAYIAAGAVATAIGYFLDRQGQRVSGIFDDRLIGITPDKLKQIPQRICVAGGPEKIVALHGVLTAGYATHLVTDEATAVALVRQETGEDEASSLRAK